MDLVRACGGRQGFWASLTRYKHQCWTWNFCVAVWPALIISGTPAHGLPHIFTLVKYVTERNGRVPQVFIDDEEAFVAHEWSLFADESPTLRAELADARVDLQLLFVITAMECVALVSDLAEDSTLLIDAAKLAFACMSDDALPRGADWRSDREDLADKCLLSNACLMYRACELLGLRERADAVAASINATLWTGSYFEDYQGCGHADTFGNAMAILCDLCPDRKATVAQSFPWNGHFCRQPELPRPNSSADLMAISRDGEVVWTVINAYAILATHEAGNHALAERNFFVWCTLEEANSEWIDIMGTGHGSVGDYAAAAAMSVVISQEIYGRQEHYAGKC